jgi:hypothetical protein
MDGAAAETIMGAIAALVRSDGDDAAASNGLIDTTGPGPGPGRSVIPVDTEEAEEEDGAVAGDGVKGWCEVGRNGEE